MLTPLRKFVINVDILEETGHIVVDLDNLEYHGCPEAEIGALNGLIGAINPSTGKFEFNLNSRAVLAQRLECCGMQEDEVEQTIAEVQDAVTHMVVD